MRKLGDPKTGRERGREEWERGNGSGSGSGIGLSRSDDVNGEKKENQGRGRERGRGREAAQPVACPENQARAGPCCVSVRCVQRNNHVYNVHMTVGDGEKEKQQQDGRTIQDRCT